MGFDNNKHRRDRPDSGSQSREKAHPEADGVLPAARDDLHGDLQDVLESAAKLQRLVPDAVLVGGSAAALYAGHRASYDHDHVLSNLRANFDVILDALEADDGWATNRVSYGKIILGELGGIETGLRQLIRTRPLEVAEVQLISGATIRVPTQEETLRIKAFLITRRNQTRDYLDVAALAETVGVEDAADILNGMDDYYADQNRDGAAVRSQVVRQLAEPRPKDSRTTKQLGSYKGLVSRWQSWDATVETCRSVAEHMVLREGA